MLMTKQRERKAWPEASDERLSSAVSRSCCMGAWEARGLTPAVSAEKANSERICLNPPLCNCGVCVADSPSAQLSLQWGRMHSWVPQPCAREKVLPKMMDGAVGTRSQNITHHRCIFGGR